MVAKFCFISIASSCKLHFTSIISSYYMYYQFLLHVLYQFLLHVLSVPTACIISSYYMYYQFLLHVLSVPTTCIISSYCMYYQFLLHVYYQFLQLYYNADIGSGANIRALLWSGQSSHIPVQKESSSEAPAVPWILYFTYTCT